MARASSPLAIVPSSFEVAFDRAAAILHLRMRGFWEVETVEAFTAAIAAVVARLPEGTRFDVLSESIDFPVQSQEVSARLADMTAAFSHGWNGRTALAVKAMLNKLQVDCTLGSPNIRAFLTVDEAMAWLRPEGIG